MTLVSPALTYTFNIGRSDDPLTSTSNIGSQMTSNIGSQVMPVTQALTSTSSIGSQMTSVASALISTSNFGSQMTP